MLDKEKIKVSVVIPIYNVEKYLEQCIESVISQTYTNLEIILVDDGSSDKCPAICNAYAERDSRIRVLHKENGGLVSARKVGAYAATGEYIIYLDGDDWVDHDLYERMLAKTEIEKVDIITFIGYIKEYEDGRSIEIQGNVNEGIYQRKEFEKSIIPHLIRLDAFYSTDLPVSICSYMVRREVLLEGQLQVDNRIRFGEDMLCVWECLLRSESIAVVNASGYHYRQQSESMLHVQNRGEFENIKILYKQLKKLFDTSGYPRDIMMKKLNYYLYFVLLLSCYKEFMNEKYNFLFPYSQVNISRGVFEQNFASGLWSGCFRKAAGGCIG